jgi:hypothetical protein
MDRTLFSPAMIETFLSCKKAFDSAFVRDTENPKLANAHYLCKKFLLKAIAEINRGKITTVAQMQKYIGQNWPGDKFGPDNNEKVQEKHIESFRFIYRALTNYVSKPYKPKDGQIIGVNLKVRARVPHTKIYLEDTFDAIAWHKESKQLEFIDYHINPLKPFDLAWPKASFLVKHFLAERLHSRFPFQKLLFTFVQVQSESVTPNFVELDKNIVQLHWADLLKTINEMKASQNISYECKPSCKLCQLLDNSAVNETQEANHPLSRSA